MTKSEAAVSKFSWGGHPFPESDISAWTLGPLVLWGRSLEDELWLSHLHRDDYLVKTFTPGGSSPQSAASIPEAPAITAKEWSRWVFKDHPGEIKFTPVFPDLPVVVKPEYPFRVIPNAMASIYVRVPIWLKISALDQRITEIPSAVLSQTWFGDTMEGELCYWLSSSARRQVIPDPERRYQAICPIKIINTSADELSVEKICLRVPSLTVFEQEGQLWSDVTTVRFRGAEAGSEIEPSGEAPDQIKPAVKISDPRSPIHRSLAARTFASIREIKGLGTFGG